MNPTPAQYLQMLARTGQQPPRTMAPDEAESEATLQEQIIDYCKGKGWWCDYSRMDMPTTRPLGSPDLYIFMDGGRVLAVECKSRSGKLRPAQLGVKMLLEKLGHQVHVVRSFSEFTKLL